MLISRIYWPLMEEAVPCDIYGNRLPEHMWDMPPDKQRSYIPDMDLLRPEVLERVKNEIPSRETSILTAARNTLILIHGYALNAAINEMDLTERAKVSKDILVYSSNFGKKVYPHYMYPDKPPKTNRGRKPRQPKNQKKRQVIGTGTDMQTQVCIWVRSPMAPLHYGYIVDRDALVYKTKFFRTGDLQIPGPNQSTLEDALEGGNRLISTLNEILYPTGEKEVKLMYMIPSLKNYTLAIKLPNPKYILSLIGLKRCLIAVQCEEDPTIFENVPWKRDIYKTTILGERPSAAPPHPRIWDVDYNSLGARLIVSFSTPLPWEPEKIIMLRIFVSGSITIIGGLRAEDVRQVCDFMSWLISKNYDMIIVKQNTAPMLPNVHFPSGEELIDELLPPPRAPVEKSYPASWTPNMIKALRNVRGENAVKN